MRTKSIMLQKKVLAGLIVAALFSLSILVRSTDNYAINLEERIEKLPTTKVKQPDKPIILKKLKERQSTDSMYTNEVKTISMRVGSSVLSEHPIKCGPYWCNIQRGGDAGKTDFAMFNRESIEYYQTPPKRRPGELWVFQSTEPQWLHTDYPSSWDGMFNYSATYLQGSHGSTRGFANKLVKKPNATTLNFAQTKRRRQASALWFVSHCTQPNRPAIGSARAIYALDLSKYLRIDVFTTKEACVKQLRPLVRQRQHGHEPSIRYYTFYLSFENSLCKDYITEKLWKVLGEDTYTIPVVLGGLSIEEYTKVAPPNSFIHVKNFTSPKALADHLKYVAENDDAFNYYLQWRNEYKLTKVGTFAGIDCYYCKLAHEKPAGRWDTFSKDFGSHNCLDISYSQDYCPYYNLSCNNPYGNNNNY